MTVIGPQGPRQGGGLSREDLAAVWSFFTSTPLGLIIALAVIGYLLYSLALFEAPRMALYMAEVKEPGEDEDQEKPDRKKSCFAVVVEAEEVCRDDPKLPAPAPDVDTSMRDPADPRSIFFTDSIDGYFESYYDLNVSIWDWAAREAPDSTEREHRRCLTQIITDRYGTKNTFVAYSGDAAERSEIKNQIGWFVTPIVRLEGPGYTPTVGVRTFSPLRPDAVKETCGD